MHMKISHTEQKLKRLVYADVKLMGLLTYNINQSA